MRRAVLRHLLAAARAGTALRTFGPGTRAAFPVTMNEDNARRWRRCEQRWETG